MAVSHPSPALSSSATPPWRRWKMPHISPAGWAIVSVITFFSLCVGVLPMGDASTFMVALICLAGGVGAIALFVRDLEERTVVLRLFLAAYLLRVVFTYLFYKAGLEPAIGGADALVWRQAWLQSRFWWDWENGLSPVATVNGWAFPNSLVELYTTSKRNSGYNYFITYFYYWLNVQSQLALAFCNCLGGALTVVFVYLSSRLFASRKASVFAALWAMLLPGMVIWSALTQKEVWVICFQIVSFYSLMKALRASNPVQTAFFCLIIALMVVLLKGLRFYISYLQIMAVVLTLMCWRAQRPGRTVIMALLGGLVLLILAQALHIVKLDLVAVVQAQLDNAEDFRTSMAVGPGQRQSSVVFDYDLHSPVGFLQMLVVGASYLLLSPFLWQVNNARQAAALPDVFAWYILLFGFILPGLVRMTRTRPQVTLSVCTFFVPLVMAYSVSFANVGLAFRQRAQFMPFLLIFAAGGHDWRRQKKEKRARDRKLRRVLRTLNTWEAPSSLQLPAFLPAQLRQEILTGDTGRGEKSV